ncbi:MAG TPA: hypothetical protein ENH99_02265 [Candidatus Pacearchaeota archaeon]|nr:hypothetical protein [Candidatus Pacearchaeota archaeon]
MGKHLKRYRRISKSVINKSFPFLKNRKIIYIEGKFKYLGNAKNLGFFAIVKINPILRNFSDKELRGFFAHELSHIQRHKERNLFEKLSFITRYPFSRKFRIQEEKGADKMTIEKGYGNELYALIKKAYSVSKGHEKRLKASHPSLNEIKRLTKKAKK